MARRETEAHYDKGTPKKNAELLETLEDCGPVIQTEYDNGVRQLGQVFARGDAPRLRPYELEEYFLEYPKREYSSSDDNSSDETQQVVLHHRADDAGWTRVVRNNTHKVNVEGAGAPAALVIKRSFFPDWFSPDEEESTEDEDGAESEPYSPKLDNIAVPTLPAWKPIEFNMFESIKQELSDNEEIYGLLTEEDSDTDDDANIQMALFESWKALKARTPDAEKGAGESKVHVGVTIVELDDDGQEIENTRTYWGSRRDSKVKSKGKGVHTDEKGPRYDELHQAGPSRPKFKPAMGTNKSAPGPDIGINSNQKAEEQYEPGDNKFKPVVHPATDMQSKDKTRATKSTAKSVKVEMAREHHFKPSNFRREQTEIPEGGYFRETTAGPGGPPDPPSSSSSSTDSSDSSESSTTDEESMSDEETSGLSSSSSSSPSRSSRRRKRTPKHKRNESSKRHKKMKRILASLKVKSPFIYDGKADLDMFDHWTYEVDTWAELHGIDDAMTVKLMVNFMGGKASRFFMKHIALRRKNWTVKLVYEGLFDYCFPANFKLQLRERLMSAKQRGSKVRDFMRDIESLSVRFPDITERQLKQIFWLGIHQSLRFHLIGKGLDPERSSLKKLAKYATRQENVQDAIKAEQRQGGDSGTPKNWTPQTSTGAKPPTAGNEKPKSNKGTGKNKRTNMLSREERERLRAEGRCFTCKEVGHESRNCPQRQTAKPPTAKTSSVKLSSLEQRATAAREAEIRVSTMRVIPGEVQLEGGSVCSDSEEQQTYLVKLFESYYDCSADLERFTAIDYDDSIEITDWSSPDTWYMVRKADLENPEYGIPDILAAKLPTCPEVSSGLPDLGEPDDEYPALDWLRIRLAYAMDDTTWAQITPHERVLVSPDAQGYRVNILWTDIEFIITHQEIKDSLFDINAVLDAVWDQNDMDLEIPAKPTTRELWRANRIPMGLRATKPASVKGPHRRKPAKRVKINFTDTVYGLERTAMKPRDFNRRLPKPIVLEVLIDGNPVRALLDTGSMADFISTNTRFQTASEDWTWQT
ncbi:hypothetical protein GGX14DRAFT_566600 [Mycena pura]|uniref:CCHC-type domain-containing protein n=1 Tax=Mycena pura TaxID=153505 RepID=A0AAD6VG58_9AGAR|nr:hypothetical protein GGX14DRAFT_566600 [Mycena pura]